MFWPPTVVLYGFNFWSFAAVRGDVSETPLSRASRLWDFQRECSILTPTSSNFSSTNTQCFDSFFLSNNNSIYLLLYEYLLYLELSHPEIKAGIISFLFVWGNFSRKYNT
jgi:hypothetical protein